MMVEIVASVINIVAVVEQQPAISIQVATAHSAAIDVVAGVVGPQGDPGPTKAAELIERLAVDREPVYRDA